MHSQEKISNSIKNRVICSYDYLSRYWQQKDFRDRWDYMFSKLTTDYYLLSKIELKDKRVLNIGCSQPIDEVNFARTVKEWVAVDISKESISHARQMVDRELSKDLAKKIRFEVADAKELPFADESFDIVVAFSTIDHIPGNKNRVQVLNEMHRVLKKGGYVVITVPNRWNIFYYFWSKARIKSGKAYFGYEYCFSPVELKKMMMKAGLAPIEFSSNFLISIAIWWEFLRPFFSPLSYLGFRMGYLARK